MKRSQLVFVWLVLLSLSLQVALAQTTGKVTPAQAADLARQVEEGVAKGDAKTFVKIFDTDKMMERSFTGLTMSAKLRSDLLPGGRSAIDQIGVVIVSQLKEGGSYKLLRIRTVDGQPRPLFRLLTKQGLNYHELILQPDEGGKIRAVDIVVYATGEPMSQTLRRLFMPYVVKENRGILDKLLRSESESIKHSAEVVRFMKMSREGPFDEAVKLYRSWPAELQNDQNMMFFYVMTCSKIDEKSYLEALDGYQKAFPTAPNRELLGLDSFFLKKDWARLVTAVDNLEKRLGGDPYLAIYRSQALAGQGKLKEGLADLDRASKEEPTLAILHWTAITISLHNQQWSMVNTHLAALERDCNMKIKDLTTIPLYGEYVKTEEYKKWLAEHE